MGNRCRSSSLLAEPVNLNEALSRPTRRYFRWGADAAIKVASAYMWMIMIEGCRRRLERTDSSFEWIVADRDCTLKAMHTLAARTPA
jgi:hypothetical protein